MIYNLDSAIQGQSLALENARQALDTKGSLHQLFGYNSGPDQYVQIHDAVTAPADGAVPAISLIIYSGANFAVSRDMLPWKFSKGIYICNSTTLATKTLGAANCWFNVQVEKTE